jgi:two-component system sensor histidine kinase DesK
MGHLSLPDVRLQNAAVALAEELNFIYAAAYLPFSVPSIRRVLTLFASEAILIAVEGAIFHAQRGVFHISWPNTGVAIFLTAIIGGGNIFSAEQRRADRKLRSALDENLALAAVAERERIARDLHDVLGHTLSVIVLKAELAGRLIARAQSAYQVRAASEIADVEGIARISLAEVREAIGGYRTRSLIAEIEAARRPPSRRSHCSHGIRRYSRL